MHYGRVGEGKSLFLQILRAAVLIAVLVLVCLAMSFFGSPFDRPSYVDASPLKIILAVLGGGIVVYNQLNAIARQFVLLRYWHQPLIIIEPDGLRMPSIFKGLLPWSDIAGLEVGGRDPKASRRAAKGQKEPHLVVRLAAGSNYQEQDLPLGRASTFEVPVPDPVALYALLEQRRQSALRRHEFFFSARNGDAMTGQLRA